MNVTGTIQITIFRLLVIAMLLLSAAGCTVVNIHTDENNVSVKRGFGFVTVALPKNAQTSIIETTGLGLVRTVKGITLGYVKEDYSILGKDCEIILYKPKKSEVKSMLELIGDSDNVCMINEEVTK